MSFKRSDYRSELYLHDTWPKFDSPEAESRILTFLEQSQWLPSQTTISRAIAHLQLVRTDGRTAKDDAREIRAAAQREYNSAVKQANELPLRRLELDEFAAMGQDELARKYWAEDGDFFRIRYNKASREFGYRIPNKPAASEELGDDGGEIQLTAAEYHALPARTILQKLRDPQFKRAVDRLIARSEI